LPFGI